MDISYDQIAHLIVTADVEGSKVYCTFQHPESDQVIESEASIKRINSFQSTATRAIKRNVSRELRRSTSRMLRSALGGGFLGRTASQIVRTSTRDNEFVKGFSNEEKQAAIVSAYKKIEHHLRQAQNTPAPQVQEASSESSVSSAGPVSEFEAHLQRFPVKEKYDQEILARMLAELATADGDIASEEEEFLNSFLPSELGTIDTFLNMDPLSPIECEEVSQKAKITILMVCAALSIIDLDLNSDEESLINEYADMLGIGGKKAQGAWEKAKQFILESHIEADTPRSELFELGAKIGMSQDDALRAQIQLKKRS
ncbi:MAG: hypothetical protein AAF587_22050 [Bacteroidota bacterium]